MFIFDTFPPQLPFSEFVGKYPINVHSSILSLWILLIFVLRARSSSGASSAFHQGKAQVSTCPLSLQVQLQMQMRSQSKRSYPRSGKCPLLTMHFALTAGLYPQGGRLSFSRVSQCIWITSGARHTTRSLSSLKSLPKGSESTGRSAVTHDTNVILPNSCSIQVRTLEPAEASVQVMFLLICLLQSVVSFLSFLGLAN